MNITAIILTLNEGIHLHRCLSSLKSITSNILIVDSYSQDSTLDIARLYGANVIQHSWTNYSTQFNWALTQLDPQTDWVLRIDADEFLTSELILEIKNRFPTLDSKIKGVYWGRRISFQGKLIRHGGVFPVQVLRLFKYGYGECENRWMDEHIKVIGQTIDFSGEMIDENHNSLTWWVDKHNQYASREAVDLLNLEFSFMPHDSVAKIYKGKQVGLKRWVKEHIYISLPGGFRAFLYFIYRYIFGLGFLDGKSGTSFHFLQGFWYRYLVDAKVNEVRQYVKSNKVSIKVAIYEVLKIKI